MTSLNKYKKFSSSKVIVKITETMNHQFNSHFIKTISGINKLTLMESIKSLINSSDINKMQKSIKTHKKLTLISNK